MKFEKATRYIDNHYRLIAVFLFILGELLIFPTGEFPLNDDWAYSKAVHTYVQEGRVEFNDLIAIPFIPQYVAGIAVTKLTGFSFFALRIISILSTFLMVFIISAIAKELNISSRNTFLVLLLFLFNPLVINMGNTFLPDTLILLFALVSFYYMIRYFSEGKIWYLGLFLVFTLLGTLTRQTGILIPLLFLPVYFLVFSKEHRKWWIAVLPFLLSWLSLFLYEWIALKKGVLPLNYNLQLDRMFEYLSEPSITPFGQIGVSMLTSMICLGLFVLPVVLSDFRAFWKNIRGSVVLRTGLILYCTLILVKVFCTGFIYPFVGNVLYFPGTGPVILTGFNSDKVQVTSLFVRVIFIILNLSGGIAFFLSVISIGRKALQWRTKKGVVHLFFLAVLLLYIGLISINYANDRYLLFVLPFFILLSVHSSGFRPTILSFSILVIPLFCFSIAGTKDYFSLNKVRWKALKHLTADKKIPPGCIDGGFEFNAWYLSDVLKYDPLHKDRWWWINRDDYIVSPEKQRKGYTIESAYPFESYMSFSFDTLYVLKRK